MRARGQRRGRWWRCKRWKRCRRWRWRCGGQLSRSSCTGCHSLAADSTKEAFSFFALQADIEAVHRSTNGSNISHRGSRSALFPHLQLFTCNLLYLSLFFHVFPFPQSATPSHLYEIEPPLCSPRNPRASDRSGRLSKESYPSCLYLHILPPSLSSSYQGC